MSETPGKSPARTPGRKLGDGVTDISAKAMVYICGGRQTCLYLLSCVKNNNLKAVAYLFKLFKIIVE